MVLSKLILEKYLNNRFVAGNSEGRREGRQEANEEWQAWYDRMVEAGKRGEDFDEPPPVPAKRQQ